MSMPHDNRAETAYNKATLLLEHYREFDISELRVIVGDFIGHCLVSNNPDLHPDVASFINNLKLFYCLLDERPEAIAIFQEPQTNASKHSYPNSILCDDVSNMKISDNKHFETLSQPFYNLNHLTALGNNDLYFLHQALCALASPDLSHSNQLVQILSDALLSLGDISIKYSTYTNSTNFFCHVLASLCCTGRSLKKALMFNEPIDTNINLYSECYDELAFGLCFSTAKAPPPKVAVQPKLTSQKQSLDYFINLCYITLQLAQKLTLILPKVSSILLELLLDLFQETKNWHILTMFVDLGNSKGYSGLPPNLSHRYFKLLFESIPVYLTKLRILNNSESPKHHELLVKIENMYCSNLSTIPDRGLSSGLQPSLKEILFALKHSVPLTPQLVELLFRCLFDILENRLPTTAKLFYSNLIASIHQPTGLTFSLVLIHFSYYSGVLNLNDDYYPPTKDFGQWVDLIDSSGPKRKGSHVDPRFVDSLGQNIYDLLELGLVRHPSDDLPQLATHYLVSHCLHASHTLSQCNLPNLKEIVGLVELLIKGSDTSATLTGLSAIKKLLSSLVVFFEVEEDCIFKEITEVAWSNFFIQLDTLTSLLTSTVADLNEHISNCQVSLLKLFKLTFAADIYSIKKSDLLCLKGINTSAILKSYKTDLENRHFHSITRFIKPYSAFGLSGMSSLLVTNSSAPFRLDIIVLLLYSLGPSSPESMKICAIKLLPRMFIANQFRQSSYLPDFGLLLVDELMNIGDSPESIKLAKLTAVGRLACSFYGACGFNVDGQPYHLGPGDLPCTKCDAHIIGRYKWYQFSKEDEQVDLSNWLLTDAWFKLFDFIQPNNNMELQLAALSSLSRLFAHRSDSWRCLNRLTAHLNKLLLYGCARFQTLFNELVVKSFSRCSQSNTSNNQSACKQLIQNLFAFIDKISRVKSSIPEADRFGLVLSLIGELGKVAVGENITYLLCKMCTYLKEPNQSLVFFIKPKLAAIATVHKQTLLGLFGMMWEALVDLISEDLMDVNGHFINHLAFVTGQNRQQVIYNSLGYIIPHSIYKNNYSCISKSCLELEKYGYASPASLLREKDILIRTISGLLLKPDLDSFSYIEKVAEVMNDSRPEHQTTNTPGGATPDTILKSCSDMVTANLVQHMGSSNEEIKNQAEHSLKYLASSCIKERGDKLQLLICKFKLCIMSELNHKLSPRHRSLQPNVIKLEVIRAVLVVIEKLPPSHLVTILPQVVSTIRIALVDDTDLLAWHGCMLIQALWKTLSFTQLQPFINEFLVLMCCRLSSLIKVDKPNNNHVGSAIDLINNIVTHSLGIKYYQLIKLPSDHPQLLNLNEQLSLSYNKLNPIQQLDNILHLLSKEPTRVIKYLLPDLYTSLKSAGKLLVKSGQVQPQFVQLVSELTKLLSCSFEADDQSIKLWAMRCLGKIGAIDPSLIEVDEISSSKVQPNIKYNPYRSTTYEDLASQLIKDHLVKLYQTYSGTDQGRVAYCIQQLLKVCDINLSLIETNYGPKDIPHSRALWDAFSPQIQNIIKPLITTQFEVTVPFEKHDSPIYYPTITLSTWVGNLVTNLALSVKGEKAKDLFHPCLQVACVSCEFAMVLIPHLVLMLFVEQKELPIWAIEEVALVLKADPGNNGISLLYNKVAQLALNLIEALFEWKKDIATKLLKERSLTASRNKVVSSKKQPSIAKLLPGIKEIFRVLPFNLLTEAATHIKCYRHGIFYLEQQIKNADDSIGESVELQKLYQNLQCLYDQLDDVDGLLGLKQHQVQLTIDNPMLDHKISNEWANSLLCHELIAKQKCIIEDHDLPVLNQMGVVEYLRNSGHYSLAQSHISNQVGSQLPHEVSLETIVAKYELKWRMEDWEDFDLPHDTNYSCIDGAVVDLFKSIAINDENNTQHSVFDLKCIDMENILLESFNTSISSYSKIYDCVLWAHLLENAKELQSNLNGITCTSMDDSSVSTTDRKLDEIKEHSTKFSQYLNLLPYDFTFRDRFLNFNRVLINVQCQILKDDVIGPSSGSVDSLLGLELLKCAKSTRKLRQFSASYRYLLQMVVSQYSTFRPEFNIELAKWHWDQKESDKAFDALNQYLKHEQIKSDDRQYTRSAGLQSKSPYWVSKARLLSTKWMISTNAGDEATIIDEFSKATSALPNWDKGHLKMAQYYYSLIAYEETLGVAAGQSASILVKLAKAAKCASASLYINSNNAYQLLPRLVTIWLNWCGTNLAANLIHKEPAYKLIMETDEIMRQLAKKLRPHLFLCVFSQLVARLNTKFESQWPIVELMIQRTMEKYPHQTLWMIIHASKSVNPICAERFTDIKDYLCAKGYTDVVDNIMAFTKMLADINNFVVPDKMNEFQLQFMTKDYNKTWRHHVLIPSQQFLSFNIISQLPSVSTDGEVYISPFTEPMVFIDKIKPNVKIMTSKVRPKLLYFKGSDSKTYPFLAKPKDDIRRDNRVMEFNALINRMFKKDPEARTRKLNIRTYSAVPLSNSSGLIEWIDNLEPLRDIINCALELAGHDTVTSIYRPAYETISKIPDDFTRVNKYKNEILNKIPVVLSRWFPFQFCNLVQWFNARVRFTNTMGVMSMVGFVLGLGDRHCENILIDKLTGDLVFVDISCLFEWGLTLPYPEVVPFRLTRNLVQAMGPSGVEGRFRKSCEMTMSILQSNKQILKDQIESFLNHPSGDFEKLMTNISSFPALRREEIRGWKKFIEDAAAQKKPTPIFAQWALKRFSDKLDGNCISKLATTTTHPPQPYPVRAQVDHLIKEAMDPALLSRMYFGWNPFL